MALLDGELVHRQQGHAAQIDGAEPFGQVPLVDGLHRIPAQIEEGRHMLDGENLAQAGHALAQSPGHPGIAVQPGKALQRRPASRTRDPAPRNVQPGAGIQDRQVANPPDDHLVNRVDPLAAAVADRRPPGARTEKDRDLRMGAVPSLNQRNTIAFPAAKPRNIINIRQRSLLPAFRSRQSEYEQRYRCLLNQPRYSRMNLFFPAGIWGVRQKTRSDRDIQGMEQESLAARSGDYGQMARRTARL